MIKKAFLLFSVLVVLFLLFLPSEVLASYCPNGWCESGEDCNNCEADCGACPITDPTDGGGWVFCGTHGCPGPEGYETGYKCTPDCDLAYSCIDVPGCPGDVDPVGQCDNDADCFPNNCYCPGNIPCEMTCYDHNCISDCGPSDGDGDGDGNGEPSGTIDCNPTSRRVCPVETGTGTTTISWVTQNTDNGNVRLSIDSGPKTLLWEGRWGTQIYNSLHSNHVHTFTLYTWVAGSGLTYLDNCSTTALCPSCTVFLPSSITVAPGDTVPIEAMVSVGVGLVNRVRFSSSNVAVATVSPVQDENSPYITNVTGGNTGAATITARVWLNPEPQAQRDCEITVNVEVRIPIWFQTQEGDVHAQTNISTRIPDNEVFCLDGDGGTPGVVSYGNDYDFETGSDKGEERVSSTDWLAQAEFSRKRFDYFYELLGSPEWNYGVSPYPVGLPADSGFYYTEDSLNVGGWFVPEGQKIVILVDNDVSIDGDVDVRGFLAIISSGKIKVAETVSQVEGVFIADREFEVDGAGAGSDVQFLGEGIFVAESFNLGRDLDDLNETMPAGKFVYRPDFWINAPKELWATSYTWQEIAP